MLRINMINKNIFSSKLFKLQKQRNILKFIQNNFSKIIQLKLGDLGEGTKEATIKQWYKKEGDSIDEVIFIFYIHYNK